VSGLADERQTLLIRAHEPWIHQTDTSAWLDQS